MAQIENLTESHKRMHELVITLIDRIDILEENNESLTKVIKEQKQEINAIKTHLEISRVKNRNIQECMKEIIKELENN